MRRWNEQRLGARAGHLLDGHLGRRRLAGLHDARSPRQVVHYAAAEDTRERDRVRGERGRGTSVAARGHTRHLPPLPAVRRARHAPARARVHTTWATRTNKK